MSHDEFFKWLKSKQGNGKLTQTQVDGANAVLSVVRADVLQDFISALTGWSVNDDRAMSKEGIDLLKFYEGLKLKAYQDTGKVWTIGYGHTSASGGMKVYQGLVITREQAEQLLKDDLARMTYPVVDDLVKVPLTQGQFDAMCSFIYNLGEGQVSKSTLLRLLNAKDYKGASTQFGRWVFDNGVELDGLIARRAAERKLFASSGDL
ncbi:putative bacteriophage lysozyme [Psychrobacter arcticus 273-4]|uniref:Lysozyme n=1 Tax=Psychrobacter arcticus (strain DSM 17307 / VKM B-2377 / 273-4) TaxID=259536 RepID=Q4FSX3_PSYA2|nr:lysozyme [Psychrobacter arcticus]AAZ18885.1 putative bacteriophage lysozyme [Psychrobacter arcticus 273-4]